MRLIICFGAASLATGIAMGAPALPVPRHDSLEGFQDACVAQNGFTTFSAQVSCVRALAAESNMNDPSTRLYLLTADKLVDDVRSRRMTVPAARVELERALIDAEKHQQQEQAENLAIQNAKQEQWLAAQRARQQAARDQEREQEREDEQRQRIAQQTQYQQAQANNQAMAATQNCVALADARISALSASSPRNSRENSQVRMALSFGQTPESLCQSNPNWYTTVPLPSRQPTTSHCDRDGMGGYDCTSE